ncbi:MAG: radical SAM family heme chaperone HemW [Flavobacteriaceae bacterium]|nr:radical SAM family heme chaperone HemW [Flavobacteriaceae bacterium]
MAGIYIHIPFCKQACHYCDFHFSTSLKKKSELLQAIDHELRWRKNELTGLKIETIYFGGGTPSLLSPDELEDILEAIWEEYQLIDDPEITLEANPDDIHKTYLESISKVGINRLSLGIQSFFDDELKLMNRAHDVSMAKSSLEIAMEIFPNTSIDLIYGMPLSTADKWKKNLETALSYDVPHISSYALTVEPKTALQAFIKKGLINEPDESVAEAQFYMMVDKLEEAGFMHYELSNFGKPGYLSKNNSAYWQGKPYLGIGPSAHSYSGTERSWNVRNNNLYIKSLHKKKLPLEREKLTITDRYNETVMTGLRTIWGVDLEGIRNEFGPTYFDYLREQSHNYIKQHLLYIENDKLLVTRKGKFLCDGIASGLFKLNLE